VFFIEEPVAYPLKEHRFYEAAQIISLFTKETLDFNAQKRL